MTLDKLAVMTQTEFISVRKDMDRGFSGIREGLKNFATKDDLKHFATKDDLKNFATKDDLKRFATKDDLKNFATKDDLQHATVEVLQAVDKIVTKFDKAEKDHAADKLLHDRHEKRLEKLEAKVFIKI